MKKIVGLTTGLLLLMLTVVTVYAAKPTVTDSEGNEYGWESSPQTCDTITAGEVFYSSGHYLAGEAIPTGYDVYGYNYQGHMFKGSYANVYLGGYGFPPYEGDDEAYLAENPGAEGTWMWPYRDIQLVMKWNDAWLANTSCDEDGKLDRHYGYSSYLGSGAWETNHMWGGEESDSWAYFVKIVAPPSDANKVGSDWYSADGVLIGYDIWGEFAVIQEVESGSGVIYSSELNNGFGYYMPKP